MLKPIEVEFSEYIAPDGTVYRFQNGYNKFLVSFSGLGMPDIDFIDETAQHGRSLLGVRYAQRVIQLIHRRTSKNRDDYWSSRSDILTKLAPSKQYINNFNSGVLVSRNSRGDIRHIKCLLQKGPEFVARSLGSWDELSFTETLRFVSDGLPFFYDPAITTVGISLDSSSHLVFPAYFADEWLFGENAQEGTITVQYSGDVPTYPQIKIVGPGNGLVIENLSTGKKIELGYQISTGEIVYINTDPGNISIKATTGQNLIGSVLDITELATFSITPDVVGGANELFFRITEGEPGISSVTISYRNFYIGI